MNFFHDRQRNALIYLALPPHIVSVLPEGKEANGYFVVPRTLRASQVLRHFNYPVPPIITDDNYDWPRHRAIKHPYESQKITANFMALHRRCFNLSDMGVGKTMATLWAADWLMRQHAPGSFRALIVAPLSILQRVWGDAIFRNFLGKRTFEILHGTSAQRLEALERPADFYIVNFDGLTVGAHTRKRLELDGFSAALAKRDDIQLTVIDEASAYKDAQTQRHRVTRLVLGKKPYLWMLTGTPTPNAPTDAYGLAKLMNNAYGKSFTMFRSETMMQVTQFKWVPQKEGYDKARALLSPSIRFDIKDVWDGPEMTVQQREVPLTAQQIKLLKELKTHLQVMVKEGQNITVANEAAARQKFMQISAGAIYDADHSWHAIDAMPRIEELKSIIEESSGKILIFAGLTSIVNMLYKHLNARWACEVVNGDVSQKERSRIFEAFQADPVTGPRIIIADPGTMAHGLDLWQARTTVWFTPTDKTELYLQANKRAHRPGQKYPVTVVQLVSNKLEQEIYRRLEANTSLQGALLDMVRRGEL